MKQFSIIAVLTFLAFSCDFNDFPDIRNESQKWELAGYQVDDSGDFKYTSIKDSAYVYSMMPDGAFTKTVGEYKLEGTYKQSTSDGLTRYRFTYSTNNSLLIHSCEAGVEDYFINSRGQLTGTWDACDGPKLYFDKQ